MQVFMPSYQIPRKFNAKYPLITCEHVAVPNTDPQSHERLSCNIRLLQGSDARAIANQSPPSQRPIPVANFVVDVALSDYNQADMGFQNYAIKMMHVCDPPLICDRPPSSEVPSVASPSSTSPIIPESLTQILTEIRDAIRQAPSSPSLDPDVLQQFMTAMTTSRPPPMVLSPPSSLPPPVPQTPSPTRMIREQELPPSRPTTAQPSGAAALVSDIGNELQNQFKLRFGVGYNACKNIFSTTNLKSKYFTIFVPYKYFRLYTADPNIDHPKSLDEDDCKNAAKIFKEKTSIPEEDRSAEIVYEPILIREMDFERGTEEKPEYTYRVEKACHIKLPALQNVTVPADDTVVISKGDALAAISGIDKTLKTEQSRFEDYINPRDQRLYRINAPDEEIRYVYTPPDRSLGPEELKAYKKAQKDKFDADQEAPWITGYTTGCFSFHVADGIDFPHSINTTKHECEYAAAMMPDKLKFRAGGSTQSRDIKWRLKWDDVGNKCRMIKPNGDPYVREMTPEEIQEAQERAAAAAASVPSRSPSINQPPTSRPPMTNSPPPPPGGITPQPLPPRNENAPPSPPPGLSPPPSANPPTV